MSEEEIISICNDMSRSKITNYDLAVQGLLDLYNKEKNKILEDKKQNSFSFKINEYIDEIISKNVISKDKIRKRIEEIRKIFPNDVMFTREFLITELKELLED